MIKRVLYHLERGHLNYLGEICLYKRIKDFCISRKFVNVIKFPNFNLEFFESTAFCNYLS